MPTTQAEKTNNFAAIIFIVKKLLFIPLSLFVQFAFAQQLSQVTFSYDGQLQYFTISTDQNVLIRISPEGQILEYGTEQMSINGSNYYAPSLLPYQGRVDTYGTESDAALQGKIKSIGSASINWYAQYEVSTRVGKLKSLGWLNIDYYDNFSVPALQGKIKSIGNTMLDYYAAPSDDAINKGKLKLLGTMPITYYSSFDDRQVKGKLKRIGSVAYDWYTSFDVNRGGLKSGNYRSQVDGITIIIR